MMYRDLPVTRRGFLQQASLLGAAAAVGCADGSSETAKSSGTTASDGPRELRVFVYAGGHEATMREVFVPRFEAATGTRVTLFSGWWDGIPKLKTAPADDPPFDLMITDATQGFPAARDGLFAEIRFENVPSHKDLAPATLDSWIFTDRLGLPYPDSVMTLAWNRSTVSEPLAGWGELLRADLAGRLGFYNHFYMSLFTFAAMLADLNGQPGTAHNLIAGHIDEVFRFAGEHRNQVKLWWPTSTEMVLALHDGTVAAGNMHSPEYLQALREKKSLAALVPVHDRAMVQVFWAIPAGTKRQNLAELALNLMFGEDIQHEFARRGMATPRPDTAARIAAEDPLWASLHPHTANQFQQLKYYPYDVYSESWDDLSDRWDRTILRSS